jgi:hypothetical protein
MKQVSKENDQETFFSLRHIRFIPFVNIDREMEKCILKQSK